MKKKSATAVYKDIIKEFMKDLGESIYLLRLERGWSLEEAAKHIKEYMLKYEREWAQSEEESLIRLEDLIQIAMSYGKKVRIRFE